MDVSATSGVLFPSGRSSFRNDHGGTGSLAVLLVADLLHPLDASWQIRFFVFKHGHIMWHVLIAA
jgi:hypothetical protein